MNELFIRLGKCEAALDICARYIDHLISREDIDSAEKEHLAYLRDFLHCCEIPPAYVDVSNKN